MRLHRSRSCVEKLLINYIPVELCVRSTKLMHNVEFVCVISSFRRDVDEICALQGYYAVLIGSSVPTFRDNLSHPSSRVKKSKKKRKLLWVSSWPLKMGPMCCPETSVQNYNFMLRNIPEERRSGIRVFSLSTSMSLFFLMEGPRSTALRLFVQTQWRWWEWAVFFYKFLQLMEHQWNEIDRGKPTTRRKTCSSATLSTTNLKWTWPGTEPRASVVRGRRLTAWAMARPSTSLPSKSLQIGH
jgi:hypothetical protein